MSMARKRLTSTFFPYTTLFRSSLGKDKGEVQKERRQRQHRDRIRPVENPVEAIEAAAEGEREHAEEGDAQPEKMQRRGDRKSIRLNSSHLGISYAVFCLKKKKA